MSTPPKPVRPDDPIPAVGLPPPEPAVVGLPPSAEAEEEREILRVVADGDATRFSVLFERYDRRLIAILASNCPAGIDPADVAHETWIKVFRSAKQFTGGNFPAWLFRIGTNAAIDAKRRVRREVADDAGILDGLAAPAAHGEIDADLEAALRDCLQKLPVRSRQIVEQRNADVPNKDVATYHRISAGTASEVYTKSLQQLGQCMEEKLS